MGRVRRGLSSTRNFFKLLRLAKHGDFLDFQPPRPALPHIDPPRLNF